MKIIALIPIKNEEWVLPSYLSSVVEIADEIIALNDSSTDLSEEILKRAGVNIISHDFSSEKVVNMSARRQVLLDAGRAAGGTHFIWLDADETFSSNFIPNAKRVIKELKPGQKVTLRWVHAWKNTESYLDDKKSPFGNNWKDFIVCDDGIANFSERFLSEARTQGSWQEVIKIPEELGVVLHWQFLNGEAMHFKHAWYKCQELISNQRSAMRINATYRVNYDEQSKFRTAKIPLIWHKNIHLPSANNGYIWHKTEIEKYFENYGVNFFEPITIWNIDYLNNIFVKQNHRLPVTKEFPDWILEINDIKNKVINFLLKLRKV